LVRQAFSPANPVPIQARPTEAAGFLRKSADMASTRKRLPHKKTEDLQPDSVHWQSYTVIPSENLMVHRQFQLFSVDLSLKP